MGLTRFAHLTGAKPAAEPARNTPTAAAPAKTSVTGGTRSSAAPAARGANPFRGQGAFETGVTYSDEQDEIIQSPAKLIVANAFAGTGKTTTAAGFAARRPGSQVLYMPFGKSVQLEAVKRFPPNTICQTISSAAYAATKELRPKLVTSWPAMTLRNEMNLASHRQAGLVHSILTQYMVSADLDIRPTHATVAIERWRATDSEIADAIAVARMAWRRMRDSSDSMPISHDALLKIWSMSNPKLPYDVIIFDEAQDTNPVTASIIQQQTHATRLYIGDRHQSIYKFRGATNAMDEMSADPSAKLLHLSRTWRFGPKVAEIANTILSELKGETVPIIGMGKDGPWKKGAQLTKLSRTNAQLFREAALTRGKGVHWVGKNGIEDYAVDRILQAHAIFKGDFSEVKDPILKHFRSWSEAQSYADDAKDPEVGVLVGIVEEFRNETPDLVRDLRQHESRNADDADVILTTGHKAKGLDWNYVQICEDFKLLADLEEKLAEDYYAPIDDQEINLLYVAATRAKTAVQLNKETATWLEDLPKHRAARLQSKRRVDERRDASRNLMRRQTA
jgi:F-box protein, helicase, 18